MMLRRAIPIGVLLVFIECASSRSVSRSSQVLREVFHESFRDTAEVETNWIAVLPSVEGAFAQLEDSAIRLTIPPDSDSDIAFRRHFDASSLRGKRVRVTARVKTDADDESFARLTVSVAHAETPPSYADSARTYSVNAARWTNVRAVIDVGSTAATGEISLVLRGAGRAWFTDVAMQIVGDVPVQAAKQLSRQQIDNVIAFSRAVALVRYRHPSDEAAELDWDVFIPAGIARVLDVANATALIHELRVLFAPIAPTVQFTMMTEPGSPLDLPRGNASHLARWWHLGLGPSSPYTSYREGRATEDVAWIEEGMTARVANPSGCGHVQLRATVQRPMDTGDPSLFIQLLGPGRQRTDAEEKLAIGTHVITLHKEVPPDTQQIRIGMRIRGRSSATLQALELTCSSGARATVDLGAESWRALGWPHLFTWNVDKCGSSTCATLSRNSYDTTFVPERDMLEEDLGNGVRVQLPLAVWANAERTLPVPVGSPLQGDFTIDDLPMRLAVIASTWGTLSIFYPYFNDQHIDWLASLSPALQEVAGSASPAATHAALDHLLTGLHDNHVRTSHVARDVTGLLPLAFRRFGDSIVVIGGLSDYTRLIPVGSEVLAFDGTPALAMYDSVQERVSAATDGWRRYETEYRLGLGVIGAFRRVRARLPDGAVVDKLLPVVASELYEGRIRDPRPKSGIEVAPGIYYVDFNSLTASAWSGLLSVLQHANAIIFDFRGYLSSGAFASLANLTDDALLAPRMEIPLVGPRGLQQPATQWSIRPAPPRLAAPIVILTDGESMSAVETFLQIVHDSHLGYVVGEPSGGTNGNIDYFYVPGGFRVQFTGMRVIGADGHSIQGRGIMPDEIVHPTLDGVRAGRDEILEAGIAAARRLVPQSSARGRTP